MESAGHQVREPYRYSKLVDQDAFRMLRLTRNGRQMIGSLYQTKLNTVARYSAISYVWGSSDATNRENLVVDGQNVSITRSLSQALVRSCQSDGDRIDVFADQVCINQDDVDERSQQVGLMGKIYEQAERTIVWLGQADAVTGAAFELFSMLRPLDEYRSLATALTTCTPLEALGHARLVIDTVQPSIPLNDSTHGILNVLRKPWFNRLWAVQEVVVASSQLFFCGQESCNLDDIVALATIAECFLQSSWDVRNKVRSVRTLWQYAMRYRQGSRSPLWVLLDDFSQTGRMSSEPHDRIYALLSLQPGSDCPDHCVIDVDYNLPTSLDVLDSRGAVKWPGFPSWVPTWTATTGISRIKRNYMPFTASGAYKHKCDKSINNVLHIRGRSLAMVTDVSVIMESDSRDDDLADFLQMSVMVQWYEALLHKQDELSKSGTHVNLLARTLTCGWASMEKPAGHGTFGQQLLSLIDELGGRGAVHRCHRRRLASMNKTYLIGLVPAETEAGDLICVIHGATAPFVLRQTGEQYQYIGACFVEGLMYDAATWPEVEANTFELV